MARRHASEFFAIVTGGTTPMQITMPMVRPFQGGKEWSDYWDFDHIKEMWRSQLHKGVTMVTAMHTVLVEAKVHCRPRRYFKRRRVCTFCEIVISEMWRFGAIYFFSH